LIEEKKSERKKLSDEKEKENSGDKKTPKIPLITLDIPFTEEEMKTPKKEESKVEKKLGFSKELVDYQPPTRGGPPVKSSPFFDAVVSE